MYEEFEEVFQAYWKIADVKLRSIAYEELPGSTSNSRLSVPAAFCNSQLSFAYWLPEFLTISDAQEQLIDRIPVSLTAHTDKGPSAPIHGVDFSGARESNGRNEKIWIASWLPDREFVLLRSGGDYPGFDRKILATKIIEDSGTWVIDFPFGPPAAIAEAAGWKRWQDYIDWCESCPDATTLQNQLRTKCDQAEVRWSTKREIDRTLGTTWFPFFHQLYRQTITGSRDVLSPLVQAGRHRVRILPFHDHKPTSKGLSLVIEGFPGATLRNFGLPATGYKHRDCKAQEQRRLIVRFLIETGIPISDKDAFRAIHDAEGDAVDALVLLCAARNASLRSTDWQNNVGEYSHIEGWFFD